jgi:hypothetical protein
MHEVKSHHVPLLAGMPARFISELQIAKGGRAVGLRTSSGLGFGVMTLFHIGFSFVCIKCYEDDIHSHCSR